MILRLMNAKGFAVHACAAALLALVLAQWRDATHWRRESARFEKLYVDEQRALASTTASYRAAAHRAHAEDEANAARIVAEQKTINGRIEDDYEKRLAAARLAAADRMRREQPSGAADPSPGGASPVSRLPAAADGVAQASDSDGVRSVDLSRDAALTATEQAIQLDELINWVQLQNTVDSNANADAPTR